ncbi:prolyl oligopeptidase family serine peptidase [Cohnella sp. CFH 77786]|uniref:alpha/beta hydrolase family protein n=1 Tax=Cohnella sp. CFH 77786 TaxID=2662265 RepID=UPI001C608B69|nr:prolyl oligopeptidase family serine peptidase [Cohnella sp. CFH 77786]MBW5446356.1 prolyl oligopeptidase family serine peptidase [Cohnella sp. CFH 77786]
MYHLTYLSDGLKVKGYLAFPYGFGLPSAELGDWLLRYHGREDLAVNAVASPLSPSIKDIRTSRWPVLLYCRGGIGHVGRVQTHWLEKFSGHGHIVFAPAYRGSESGEGRDEFGGRDREDVLAAYRLLQSLPFADPERFSFMGFSRGSINAVLAAIRTEKPHKLVLWGGVSDLAQTYEERIDLRRMLKRVIGGSPAAMPEAYRERSPLCLADRIRSPVLLIHGTEDAQVPFSHALRMYDKLRQAGATPEFHRYEGYGHHLPSLVHDAAIGRMFDWLAR